MEDGDVISGFESDKDDGPARIDATLLERSPIHKVLLSEIRPTQLAVGMQQVGHPHGTVTQFGISSGRGALQVPSSIMFACRLGAAGDRVVTGGEYSVPITSYDLIETWCKIRHD